MSMSSLVCFIMLVLGAISKDPSFCIAAGLFAVAAEICDFSRHNK